MTWQFLTAGPLTPAGLALTWFLQSTVLLADGLVAGHLMRKLGPAVQSALYRTTLAAVVLCPVASALMAAIGFNALRIPLPAPVQAANNTAANNRLAAEMRTSLGRNEMQLHGDEATLSISRHVLITANFPNVAVDRASEAGTAPPMTANVPSLEESVTAPRSNVLIVSASAVIFAVWLVGAAVLAMLLVVAHVRMARLRSSAIEAEPEVLALCRNLARQMHLAAPRVLRTPFLCSPCLDGMRRPAILLPEDAKENLRETFIHELAHLERRDGLWNLLRRAATAAFWMQPLLWLLSKRLETTAEEVCDDYVVEFGADRCGYARLLLELAERRLSPLAPSGVGMISLRSLIARRITRILDTTRTLSTHAGRRAIATTLLAGVAGTLLVGLLGVGTAKPVVMGEEPNAANSEAKELKKPMNSIANQGKGASRMMPITGQIVDLEGQRVVGATLRIRGISKPKGDNLDAWIEAVKSGEPPWIAYQHFSDEPATMPDKERLSTTADSNGRFRFDGLEAERVVGIIIEGPTIGYSAVDVITRPSEPIAATGFPSFYGSYAQHVYGADFTRTAAPGRPIEGIVRDAQTNQPLAGVELVSDRFAGSFVSGITELHTTTDEQGRFRLIGLPKGNGNTINALPSLEQPYFMREVPVPDPPGVAPVQVDIALHQGIWIEGKVSDKETGSPVPGAWVHYFPFLENTFARATPEFDRNGYGPQSSHQDRYQTKSDGTYRLVGLPGRAIVGVLSHSKTPYLMGDGAAAIKGMNQHGYFATWGNPVPPSKIWPTSMKEINPSAATKVVRVDFELESGERVRMRAVDPQGKPVTGLTMAGRLQRGQREFDLKPEADFDVVALAPGENRMVLIQNDARKLGKVVHVKPGDDTNGPMTVTLEPLASIIGRVADADGNPCSGARIQTSPEPRGNFSLHLNQVVSGRDGRFVVPSVPIGCEYSLVAEIGLAADNRRGAFFQGANPRPGESTDVGEMRLKKVD
jgi:beta-lactamase regulating signal transducer with metallopeptidase domain/protocatechuate 3,4-dioxygenase beta subunit